MLKFNSEKFLSLHTSDPYEDWLADETEVDTQGWFSTAPIFETLIKETKPKIIIEVGTWKGASAIHMAELCQKHSLLDTKIICVDTWLGSYEHFLDLGPQCDPSWRNDLKITHGYPQLYYTFINNVVSKKLTNFIIPLPLPSNTAAKVLETKGITADLIYLDGDHSNLASDINNYWFLLNRNGTLLIDDYGDENWLSVTEDVADFLLTTNAETTIERHKIAIKRKQ